MSMNGTRSSCLARGTHVLQARGCIFMSWTHLYVVDIELRTCFVLLACRKQYACNCVVRLTFKEIVSLSKVCSY